MQGLRNQGYAWSLVFIQSVVVLRCVELVQPQTFEPK